MHLHIQQGVQLVWKFQKMSLNFILKNHWTPFSITRYNFIWVTLYVAYYQHKQTYPMNLLDITLPYLLVFGGAWTSTRFAFLHLFPRQLILWKCKRHIEVYINSRVIYVYVFGSNLSSNTLDLSGRARFFSNQKFKLSWRHFSALDQPIFTKC